MLVEGAVAGVKQRLAALKETGRSYHQFNLIGKCFRVEPRSSAMPIHAQKLE